MSINNNEVINMTVDEISGIVMCVIFGGIILYFILKLYFEYKLLCKQIEHGVNIKRVN